MNINTPVRVIADCKWRNLTGTICDEAAGYYRVAGLDSGPVWFYGSELERVISK